jgi:uncharacterized protein DUF6600
MRTPAKSLMLLIQLLAAPAFAQVEPPARVGRVSLVSGALAFYGPGDSDWSAAKVNLPVAAGAWLATDPQSRAELRIGADSLDLANDTQLDFAELRDRVMQVALTQGRVNLHLRRLQPDETAEIDVPRGGVWLLQPGAYDIDSGGPDLPTRVTVFEGSARFVGGGIDTLVKAGDVLVLSGAGTLSAAVEHAAPDDFVRWCRAHDYDEKRLASPHHVSPAMTGYEELDEYGEWAAAPAYGEVWYPRSVPAGWAPYRDGRWVWVEPWGWNWVDDAPWGFAPCHYGRWARIDDRWGWIPGGLAAAPVYAPALVAFIPPPASAVAVPVPIDAGPPVGWFPLAPGEVYWPAYTRNPTYIRNVNITSVNITKLDTIIAARPAAGGAPQQVAGQQFANRAAATVVPSRALVESRQAAAAALAVPPQVLRQAAVAVTPPVLPRPAARAPAARAPAATAAAPPSGHTMPAAPGGAAALIQPPSSTAAQAKLAGPAPRRPPIRPNFSELAPAPRVSPTAEVPRKSPTPQPGVQAPAAGARLPAAAAAPAPHVPANATLPAHVPGHPPGAPDFSHLAPARVGPHLAPQPAQHGPQPPANPAPAAPPAPAPEERVATPRPARAPPVARAGVAQPLAPDHGAPRGAAAETAARQQAEQRAAAEAAARHQAVAAQQAQQRAAAEAAARHQAVAAQQAQQRAAAEAAARHQAVAAQQAQQRAAAEAAARHQAVAAQQAQQRAAAEAAARQRAAQPVQQHAATGAAQHQGQAGACGHPGQPACPK